ncbi:MAG TPA: hypothetical protein VHN99_08970 [Deinococcales bacterium]|nr:hypothetical protein [Deinococcales bacterium]
MTSLAVPAPTETLLRDPAAFEAWWLALQGLGVGVPERLRLIEAVGGPVAQARATHAHAELKDYEAWAEAAGLALLSDDPDVRYYAMVRLAAQELFSSVERDGSRLGRGADTVLPTLRALLQGHQPCTPLGLEAQQRLHMLLAQACGRTGEHEDGLVSASQAVLLAKALTMPGAQLAARLQVAARHAASGHLGSAIAEYGALEETHGVPEPVRRHARLNRALALLSLGEDDLALASLAEGEPDGPAQACLEYALAVTGRGEPAPVLHPAMDVTMALETQAFGLLMAEHGQPDRETLEELLGLAGSFPSMPRRLQEVGSWLRALALHRLGRGVQAALQAARLPAPIDPDRQVLSGTLRLQIDLNFLLDAGPRSVEDVENLSTVFSTLSPSARVGLAARVGLWLPQAAAFLAFAPGAPPEFAPFSAGVFRIARPIVVYGQGGLSRVEALELTLSAFGLGRWRRERGGEEARELAILETNVGTRRVRRTLVPPALMVFKLLQAGGERASWKAAAHQLAESHGLVPTPQDRDYRAHEREALEQALRACLWDALRPSDLKRRLTGL